MHSGTPTSVECDRQSKGWLYLIAIMICFPILFFLCVYFPIWMGWAVRYP